MNVECEKCGFKFDFNSIVLTIIIIMIYLGHK